MVGPPGIKGDKGITGLVNDLCKLQIYQQFIFRLVLKVILDIPEYQVSLVQKETRVKQDLLALEV